MTGASVRSAVEGDWMPAVVVAAGRGFACVFRSAFLMTDSSFSAASRSSLLHCELVWILSLFYLPKNILEHPVV